MPFWENLDLEDVFRKQKEQSEEATTSASVGAYPVPFGSEPLKSNPFVKKPSKENPSEE